jgi:RNA polymerase sigma-54 factor
MPKPPPVMTPELKRAIKLLKASRLELVDMVREEMLRNPFLEDLAEPADEEAKTTAGRQDTAEEPTHITPDVHINKVGDEYLVVANDDGLPKLRISDAYRFRLAGHLEERESIKEKLRNAAWLIRSIQQRERAIVRVTESIVKFQRDYFDKGIAHLKPLILRDVAEDTGMHESTVSRITLNKYAETRQGTYVLKYFFNSA